MDGCQPLSEGEVLERADGYEARQQAQGVHQPM